MEARKTTSDTFMTKIPTGLFSRGRKLAMAGAKLAVQEVSSKLKTWETENEKLQAQIKMAQSLVKTMAELKGASMKVGQLLSLDIGDLLPKQVSKVLETLHQDVTFLPFGDIEKILKSELGEKFSLLSEISKEPIAAASIGQVHRAKFHGQDVVLKVQYPGVAESIPSDLRILNIMLTNFNMIQGKNIDFTSLLKEIEDVLVLETDYEHELSMLKTYRKNFSKTQYIVPEAFDELCTKKVLCMEYIDGEKLSEWIETAPESERQKITDQLINLYLTEFFSYGLVQTDPNPGNFLMTRDHQLVLLDFGASKKYDKEFITGYRKVLDAAIAEDDETILRESFKLQFLDERESDDVKNIFLKLMKVTTAFFQEDSEVDFGDKNFITESQKLSWELIRSCRYSPPPRALFFLHRKLGGLFAIIRRMNVRINLRSYWKKLDLIE